ncbi:MAG: recombinase XerC [Pelagibacterium sp.]|nr:recombinase XerC [Pelagibacterium sp.]|tara:strand:- start:11893 stop:12999 length:1107 start_codon:yes stop_codon:yes gene_type:complete
MAKHHPENERIKRQYFAYLEEAKRMAPSSVDQVAASIVLFEKSTGYRSFKAFHIEQAKKFKRDLDASTNPKTGKPLAKSTIHSRLMALKAFMQWLAGQQGYKSRISYSDADYFNPSANDTRIAKAEREKRVPTLAQIRHVLDTMPTETVLERRDRALIACTLLSGARDNAIASLKIKHIDLEARKINQDAREVRTKNRKSFVSWFFPVGDAIEQIVKSWIEELVTDHLFGPDDPVFPATKIGFDDNGHFAPMGITREGWSNATAIRRIFRDGFAAAGLPYFNPHSFRDTLGLLGQRTCNNNIEALKAWSQNMGHEQVLTTLMSYGAVARDRQGEIMQKIGKGQSATAPYSPEVLEMAEKLIKAGIGSP